jgi:hypothetical protein
MSCTPQFFVNIFQAEVPSIFFINIDKEDENDGYTTVQRKAKGNPKNPPKQQSVQETLRS